MDDPHHREDDKQLQVRDDDEAELVYEAGRRMFYEE